MNSSSNPNCSSFSAHAAQSALDPAVAAAIAGGAWEEAAAKAEELSRLEDSVLEDGVGRNAPTGATSKNQRYSKPKRKGKKKDSPRGGVNMRRSSPTQVRTV